MSASLKTPKPESAIALTATFFTLVAATKDIRNLAKVLNSKNAITALRPSHAFAHDSRPSFIASHYPFSRGLTSAAFFYLAYRDYGRATTRAELEGENDDGGLASGRWREWALCGATTLAMFPYHNLLLRPLELRIQSRGRELSGKEVERLVTRWGVLTMGKASILLLTFPMALKAYVDM